MKARVVAMAIGCALASSACAESMKPPARTAATAPPVDRAAAERAIRRELDDFHHAAAHADEARYFAHFASDGVFLGTDATERWDLAAFRAFAHPHFAKGKAWAFHATRRAITLDDDGHSAWFDEDLATERLGPARGSGVLVLRDGAWKIAQYNLTITIPNERFDEVHKLLDPSAVAHDVSFEERSRDAYARAVDLAGQGKVADAEHALESMMAEADTREADAAAFWLHNDLTWLRWSEGDLAGALREIDGAKTSLARAQLPAPQSARTGLHEKWDRAYILLEMAEASPTPVRAKAHASAEDARVDYVRAATPLGDHDGMAVLDAFFAVRAHDARRALAAAKRVEVEKDDDVQDLYVLALAFERGGDRARADAIRARIRGAKDYLMKPLIVRQMDVDAGAKPAAR